MKVKKGSDYKECQLSGRKSVGLFRCLKGQDTNLTIKPNFTRRHLELFQYDVMNGAAKWPLNIFLRKMFSVLIFKAFWDESRAWNL